MEQVELGNPSRVNVSLPRLIPAFRFLRFVFVLFTVLWFLAPTPVAHAAGPLYAKPGGMTSGACDSWTNACTLRYAMDNSVLGDEIWVAGGTYTPTLSSAPTDRTATFQLKSGVAIYGGFNGTESTRDARNPAVNVTVLSGDLNGDDIGFNNNGENSYHVVTGATGATLDGVTISGGNANGSYPNDRGAGMYNDNSSPTLTNITFSGNSATYGGGMFNISSNPTLTNVTFNNNSAANYGGGMYNQNSNPTLTNVTFSGNSTTGGGNGGGMYNWLSNPTIRNSILWGNTAVRGAQIYNASATSTIGDSVVQGGCPDATSTCTNIITSDPLLGTLGNYGGNTQILPLLPGSSAIDAGNDTICAATVGSPTYGAGGLDQRGIARPQGAHCDIGAFESQGFMFSNPTGTLQSTTINTAFANPLGLNVTSAGGEPVNGGKVTFTAPSSGASTNPATNIATIAVGGAVLQSVTANGTVGSYTVTPSANGAASVVSFALTNIKGDTTTSVTSSPNPSALGQSVTLTATVSPSSATGTVQFYADGAPLGSPVTLSSSQATTSTAALAPGTHPITATYSGDATYNGNTSSAYVQTVMGTTVYAKPSGLSSGACELRYALTSSAAGFGQEIWVSAGTYTPSATGDRTAAFQLKSGVAIYGGFAMTETLRTQRNPATNVVTLSGDLGTGFSNNSYHVVIGATGATLDGVTISGGNANADGACPSAGCGGGMLNWDSSPTLTNVTFSGNYARVGGGMFNYYSSNPTLTNVTFSGNSARVGGGMYNYASGSTLTNVTFSGNYAYSEGGGMYNDASGSTMTNVTFNGNYAHYDGGGMYNYFSAPQVQNSIFWGDSGGEIMNNGMTPTLRDSIVQGYVGGWNMITGDPLLGTLGNYGGSTQTIPLLPGSSASNAASSNCPATDQRGIARSWPTCDIGAFESQGFTLGNPTGNNQSTMVYTTFAAPLDLMVTPNNASEPVNGGKVTFTAPSSGASTNPAINMATIGTGGAVSQSVTANGTVGSYTVAASASGATSVSFALTNLKGNTTTTLTGAPNPSALGQTVTFTATVSPSDAPGTVQFFADGAPLGSTVTLSSGQATMMTASLIAGTHPITATYSGDANNNASASSTYTQTVADTTTTLASAPNPSAVGQTVTFTATILPSSATGTVQFYADGAPLGSPVTLSSGQATMMTASLIAGTHPITATFSGDTTYNGSISSTYTQGVWGTLLYAKPGGLTSGYCESWTNACELSYALTSSVSGQEIWVAAGTYKPTSGMDRTATFQLKNGVAVYGGFAMTETLHTQRNPSTNVVILSGDLNGNDVGFTNNAENSYHVVTGATGATLDGVTISGGNANGSYADQCGPACGGGMYNVLNSNPTLTNVTFSGNSASTTGGGGMYNDTSSPALTNVTFSGNSANWGGGMLNGVSSSPTLTNVTFSGNSAANGGGMENISSSNPMLTNVTISGNSASGFGGGIFNHASSNPQVRNSILWGNTASNGAEIYNSSSTPSVTNSVVEGGCPTGSTCTNIITTDPVLGSLGNYGGGTMTVPLLPSSSAIDMANATYCPATDQRGQARDDLQCDIGAFERKYSDGNYVILTPSTSSMTTYGPARVGIQDLGSTHPGIITATKVTNWTSGTPNGTLGVWWDLQAPTTTGLSLTLELCYSDAEKGNFAENASSHFWRYSGGTWSDAGAVASFTGTSPNRCAQISGVTGLSRWTLATGNPGGAPTSVLVQRWVAISKPNAVRLEWQTLLDLGVVGYQVERTLDGKTFTPIGNLFPAIGGGTYSIEDTTLPRGKTATYRLIVVRTNGMREMIGTITASMGSQLFLPLIRR